MSLCVRADRVYSQIVCVCVNKCVSVCVNV
jgi:hypothetical protein